MPAKLAVVRRFRVFPLFFFYASDWRPLPIISVRLDDLALLLRAGRKFFLPA